MICFLLNSDLEDRKIQVCNIFHLKPMCCSQSSANLTDFQNFHSLPPKPLWPSTHQIPPIIFHNPHSCHFCKYKDNTNFPSGYHSILGPPLPSHWSKITGYLKASVLQYNLCCNFGKGYDRS